MLVIKFEKKEHPVGGFLGIWHTFIKPYKSSEFVSLQLFWSALLLAIPGQTLP